jgi:hypothetical protein
VDDRLSRRDPTDEQWHRLAPIMPADARQDRRRSRGHSGGRPPAFDSGRYNERNTVERCFSKLKKFRVVATRYDKREFTYQGTVDVASIRIWPRVPSHDRCQTPWRPW